MWSFIEISFLSVCVQMQQKRITDLKIKTDQTSEMFLFQFVKLFHWGKTDSDNVRSDLNCIL